MTFQPGGPLARRQAAEARAGHHRRPPILLGVIVVIILLLVAANGGRAWWARRVGDLTHGSHVADFLIGLAVGLLPVIAVFAASLSRGRGRVLRMFVAGAVGFVITDLLAPSLWRAVSNNQAAIKPFETHAPWYLPGVYVGIGIWLALLVVAFVRVRRAFKRRFSRF